MLDKILDFFLSAAKTVAFLVLAIIAIIWALFWYHYEFSPYRGAKFNKEIWMLAGEAMGGGVDWSVPVFPTDRCPMYSDLVHNHLHKGMSLQEVEDLLGKNELWHYCKDKKIKATGYVVGSCASSPLFHGGFRILRLVFNKNNDLIKFGKSSDINFCSDEYNEITCDKSKQFCTCYKKDKMWRESYKCKIDQW